jgi:hypothetical protein
VSKNDSDEVRLGVAPVVGAEVQAQREEGSGLVCLASQRNRWLDQGKWSHYRPVRAIAFSSL